MFSLVYKATSDLLSQASGLYIASSFFSESTPLSSRDEPA